MEKDFVINPRLAESAFVCNLPLCQVRLHPCPDFPFIVMTPRRPNMVELIDLSIQDQEQLLVEIRQASFVMKDIFKPFKLNISTHGNIVPQLHIHVIARFQDDAAWPNAIWGKQSEQVYTRDVQEKHINALRDSFLKILS